MEITKQELSIIKSLITAAVSMAETHSPNGNEPIWAHIEDAQDVWAHIDCGNFHNVPDGNPTSKPTQTEPTP